MQRTITRILTATFALSLSASLVACGSSKTKIVASPAPSKAVASDAAPATMAPVIPVVQNAEAPACKASLTVYFPLDVAQLDSRDQTALQNAADCLKTGESSVRIEGHADPRGTEAYNLGLAERRAKAVKRYLTALGVPAGRLETVSYGEVYARGDDPSTWKFDRRAELEVSKR